MKRRNFLGGLASLVPAITIAKNLKVKDGLTVKEVNNGLRLLKRNEVKWPEIRFDTYLKQNIDIRYYTGDTWYKGKYYSAYVGVTRIAFVSAGFNVEEYAQKKIRFTLMEEINKCH